MVVGFVEDGVDCDVCIGGGGCVVCDFGCVLVVFF